MGFRWSLLELRDRDLNDRHGHHHHGHHGRHDHHRRGPHRRGPPRRGPRRHGHHPSQGKKGCERYTQHEFQMRNLHPLQELWIRRVLLSEVHTVL